MNQEIAIPKGQTNQWYFDNVLTEDERRWFALNMKEYNRELEGYLNSSSSRFFSFINGSFNHYDSKHPFHERSENNYWVKLKNKETYIPFNKSEFTLLDIFQMN
jgi:hypothetical protein